MFLKIYAVLSVLIESIICLFTDIISGLGDLWVPIVLFLGIFVAFLVFHLLVMVIASLLVNKKKPCPKPNRFYKLLLDYTAEIAMSIMRVKVVANGFEKLPSDKRFLLVSNHRSSFDPIATIPQVMKFDVAFISKPENFRIPIASEIIHKCCYLPIDRDNARNAMRTIHSATEFVKNNILSVAVYPEGTRSKTDELLEFKDGVFYIAKKSPCPIVIMTVNGTEKIKKNFPFRKTVIHLDVLKVLEIESFIDKSTHEISEEVKGIMLENLK